MDIKIGDYVEVKTSSDVKTRSGIVKKIYHGLFKLDGVNYWYNVNDIISQPIKTATKHDNNKNRLELIPVSGIEGVGRAMTFGAKKYEDHNWAKGFAWSRLIGATLRHILTWARGENKDPESGLSHLAHAGACIMMLIAHETEGLGNDDRRKTKY